MAKFIILYKDGSKEESNFEIIQEVEDYANTNKEWISITYLGD